MMPSYQIEKFSDCLFEIARLFPQHWEEMVSHKDIRKLDVAWEMYLEAEQRGQIALATARSGELERLTGYLVMLVLPDPHARQSLAADSCFYYVEPRPARGLIQRGLIRCMRDYLLSRGIKYQRISNEMAHSADPILRNCGFRPTAVMYTLGE